MQRILTLLAILAAVLPRSCIAANDPRTVVAILMFDGVQIIDFAAPYEVFGQAGFDVFTVSSDGRPVKTAMDLGVQVDHSFASAPEADVLLIPGGSVHDAMEDERTLAWVRERAAPAEHVMSVCTGSYILGNAGLLEGGRATTFFGALDDFEEQFPATRVVRNERWVDSGKVVTSAGLASGIDAAFHLVARIRGEAAARTVATHLEYDWTPDQGYVRGRLADRHLRWPEPAPAFPEGSDFDRTVSYGDMTSWTRVYRVQSAWGPEELLEGLAAAFRDDAATLAVRPEGTTRLTWEYRGTDGQAWRLIHVTDAPDDGGAYAVTQRLEAIEG